jgi:hypothetical protein
MQTTFACRCQQVFVDGDRVIIPGPSSSSPQRVGVKTGTCSNMTHSSGNDDVVALISPLSASTMNTSFEKADVSGSSEAKDVHIHQGRSKRHDKYCNTNATRKKVIRVFFKPNDFLRTVWHNNTSKGSSRKSAP